MMFFKLLCFTFFISSFSLQAQVQWKNINDDFGPLPSSVQVYFTEQKIDTAPFRAFYVSASLNDKDIHFSTDTSYGRRLTPSAFYEKNNGPLLVVNGTFFSFQTNSNLNLVMNKGRILSHQSPLVVKAKDTTAQKYFYGSAIGIDRQRKADVAWIIADSAAANVFASQVPTNAAAVKGRKQKKKYNLHTSVPFMKWQMETAIGGGPVLVQNGEIKITNNEERRFGGKAIHDKHPRTAMGYTADGNLIILMVEGRNPEASGATLLQLAELMKTLGCVEALNLDGGGSSCLLLNGKETIKPSDKTGQRPVPGVFMITRMN